MSCKHLVLLAACTVLLLIASVSSAAASESVTNNDPESVAKSYFGYQPKPNDSYKKLVEDVDEFTRLYLEEFTALGEKIETLHKKLYHRKDKDHGGYNYNDMAQMHKLLSQQKAALDALRSERPSV
ncbi:uncharacterized protein LOC128712794 [Anopheles marshallii]|uniref:uncharacterized protein LOC128712794 n=1 Tax=Anopheles marshallii TaxID=1521116 RepID=UPI00237A288E|nr:uncharacterized protein LOC128712794 [Anopheles marshallii]